MAFSAGAGRPLRRAGEDTGCLGVERHRSAVRSVRPPCPVSAQRCARLGKRAAPEGSPRRQIVAAPLRTPRIASNRTRVIKPSPLRPKSAGQPLTRACAACANAPDSLFNFSRRLTDFFVPPLQAATASGASVVASREMSSAAADSTDTSAPKPSVGASRRVHRAVPDQGSATKHRAAQPNTAAGRTAAKHADAQKAGSRPAERRSAQVHGARSAS